MPNWCNNTVLINGPTAKINRIKKAIEGAGFLNYLNPMPPVLKNTTADGSKREDLIKQTGHSDWYGWCTDNWGTKWEVSPDWSDPVAEDMGDGESQLNWGFDSAWSPPIGAYEHFLAENDDVSIFATYYEPGCDFMGVWDSGDDRCYQVGDYDSQDDFWDTADGMELDNNYGIVENKAEWEEEQKAQEEDVTEYVKGRARNLDKLHIGEDA